jgi:hypothetical protein
MKTKTIQIYEFNELSESAKEKAIEQLRDASTNYEWWDCIYEDAKEAGVFIESFDLDRNRHAKGYFSNGAEGCAHFIADNHGETCETYVTAKTYLTDRDKIIESAQIDADGEFESEYNLDSDLDNLDNEFLRSIFEDYSIILQAEWDGMNSNEHIIDFIEGNGYTFTEYGKIENI